MERPGDSEPSKGRARYDPESKKRRGKPFHNAGASRSSVAISGAAARGNAAASAGLVSIEYSPVFMKRARSRAARPWSKSPFLRIIPGGAFGSGGAMATIVVAHGAWSAGWAWKKVRPLLRARGHEVFTPTYTGLGERAHLAAPSINLDTHIRDILNVLEYEDLSGVVLVGHSYGGMVATGVADRARERIRQLIYLDAFVPEDGKALHDYVPAERREAARKEAIDGWRVQPPVPPPDTSPEDVAWITARRMPQPLQAFEQPLRLRGGPLTCRGATSTARATRRGRSGRSMSGPRKRAGRRTRSTPATRRTSRRRSCWWRRSRRSSCKGVSGWP